MLLINPKNAPNGRLNAQTMEKYKVTVIVEIDDMGPTFIKRMVDRDLNRGDGIWMDIDNATIDYLGHEEED